jgi:hypothetical protein
MSPISANHNPAYTRYGYSIIKRYGLHLLPSRTPFSYLHYFFIVEYGITAALSAKAEWIFLRPTSVTSPRGSLFLCHIGGVLSRCTQPKVGWIAAWWVIAGVAHQFPSWIDASSNKVGYSMREESDLISRTVVEIKPPVSSGKTVACPRPALIATSPIDSRQEFINQIRIKRRNWLKLNISHMISSVDLWSEPRNVLIHLRGSFYFNAISLEAI